MLYLYHIMMRITDIRIFLIYIIYVKVPVSEKFFFNDRIISEIVA